MMTVIIIIMIILLHHDKYITRITIMICMNILAYLLDWLSPKHVLSSNILAILHMFLDHSGKTMILLIMNQAEKLGNVWIATPIPLLSFTVTSHGLVVVMCPGKATSPQHLTITIMYDYITIISSCIGDDNVILCHHAETSNALSLLSMITLNSDHHDYQWSSLSMIINDSHSYPPSNWYASLSMMYSNPEKDARFGVPPGEKKKLDVSPKNPEVGLPSQLTHINTMWM